MILISFILEYNEFKTNLYARVIFSNYYHIDSWMKVVKIAHSITYDQTILHYYYSHEMNYSHESTRLM